MVVKATCASGNFSDFSKNKYCLAYRKVNQVLERKVVEWFEYTWTRGQAKVDESVQFSTFFEATTQ
jgi:hypothetical protein